MADAEKAAAPAAAVDAVAKDLEEVVIGYGPDPVASRSVRTRSRPAGLFAPLATAAAARTASRSPKRR